jgi:hypothetical protein
MKPLTKVLIEAAIARCLHEGFAVEAEHLEHALQLGWECSLDELQEAIATISGFDCDPGAERATDALRTALQQAWKDW